MTSWRVALDAQSDMWKWLRSDVGRHLFASQFRAESEGLDQRTRELQARLYAGVEATLLSADPIFVSAEMCELVAAAADTNLDDPFRPEAPYVTDLPTPCGFLYYETPFAIPDRFDRPVTVKAFSWTPLLSLKEGPDEVDDLTVTDALSQWQQGEFSFDHERVGGVSLAIYDEPKADEYRKHGFLVPPLEVMHVTPWWFGMSLEGNEVDAQGVQTGAHWWWRIAQVTFRLMQQKLAAKEPTRGDRHQRRGLARSGFGDRDTVVVRLRRHKNEGDHGESGPANYSHRFIVSGHWRNQWYPKSEEHRQLWISPFVKGDESLPLVVKPRRAMVWSR